MEIGNDDIDLMDDEFNDDITTTQNIEEVEDLQPGLQDTTSVNTSENDNDTVIAEFLKSKGVEDISKIKFENDNGEIEEIDWNSLNNEDKLNILNSTLNSNDSTLDPSEIQLLNTYRASQLEPEEFIRAIQQRAVLQYIENTQNLNKVYSIDQYSDDELYVLDLISRANDITAEEAAEILEKAKTNEVVFKKQVYALREDYKKKEEESLQNQRLEQELEALKQYELFAYQIQDSITNFKEFSGCELNMDQLDMQELYDFITGFDSAGNSWFGKALADPETVVKMAWFALNGEKMIADINNYYQKEITNVRKESYNKGKEDANKKTNTVYKPKTHTKPSYVFDDNIDDFV